MVAMAMVAVVVKVREKDTQYHLLLPAPAAAVLLCCCPAVLLLLLRLPLLLPPRRLGQRRLLAPLPLQYLCGHSSCDVFGVLMG